MPPRKRKRNASVNNEADKLDAKKVKVVKTNVSLTALTIVWQLENDGREWEMIPKSSILLLNKAWKAKHRKVVTEEDDEECEYNLYNLTRTSKRTDSVWKIRCGVKLKNEEDVGYIWNSINSNGCISDYKPEQVLKIELAYRNSESPVVLKIGKRNYTFDFKKWKQKANTIKDVCKITRKKFEIKEPVHRNEISVKDSDSEDSDESEAKEVVIKEVRRKIPVDSECHQKAETAHVYYDGNDTWDVTLNQTNLQYNNNKYYIIQLLEGNDEKAYSVFCRWGRVGNRGQCKLLEFGNNVMKACEFYEDKFHAKTGNDWNAKHKFEKQRGLYDLIQTYYSSSDSVDEVEDDKIPEKPSLKSKLDIRVKDLMEMIFDIKAMEEAVIKMKYDAKKAPLGKLTVEQIKAGYSSLKRIESLLEKEDTGRNLTEACNTFYTQIPHCFGMRRPPLIRTSFELRQEILLLEALGDIHAALKTLNKRSDVYQHPVDNHYLSLKCELIPLDKDHQDYKRVEKYLHNSHTDTHNQYILAIEEIFTCNKHLEEEKFRKYENRMLLWHGSRITNFAGILSKGLRVAPPEAPVTGYMFGKGVYFADRSSKSANYCFSNIANNVGLLLLCEVSLGESNELIDADYFAGKLPKGKHSVVGIGKIIPDPSQNEVLDDGVVVPLGKGIERDANKYFLNYNEYIVYNVDQIRMRYLVKVRFKFPTNHL